MNNDNRNNPEYTPEVDPWDRGTYQTGSTKPPKSYGGLVAVLIVTVILLCSTVSVLTLLNIRLFQENNQNPTADTSPLSIKAPERTDPSQDSVNILSTEPVYTEPTAPDIQITNSPVGEENIPQAGGLSLQGIYTKVIDSVVSISCSVDGGTSSGTGLVLTENGYIVTNAHVVEGANTIHVLLNDGRTLEAALVGADAVSDLAVLWVDARNLQPAELGDAETLRVGDLVVAIGDPLGISLRGTMTDGIVSGINRDISVDGRPMTLIQTNAALNEGNSGGPLINCYGQVIGINTMKIGDAMSAAGVEGLGFAIPSTIVRDIVTQLIGQGYVSGRPELGLEGVAVSRIHQIYGYLPSGLYITAVKEGSSAYNTGIQTGDVLVSMGGVRVTGPEDYEAQLYTYAPGDVVTAIIYRDGRQYEVRLTVGEAGA